MGLAPAHTVAEGRVKTGPLWSNLELGYCDRKHGLNPWVGKSSGEGNGNRLQYSCLKKSHGQRSLVD